MLSALAAVALVLELYSPSDRGACWLGEQNLAALHPMTRGSLSSWLSSALLGLAAIGSVAVFSTRRQRTPTATSKTPECRVPNANA